GLVDADVPPARQVDPGGRDGCRAPIPWDDEPLHGWHADPWLPFPPESDVRNVAAMRADAASILHWYRRLIALRRAQPAFHSDAVTFLDGSPGLFAWTYPDTAGGEWSVYVNPTDQPQDAGGRLEGATVVLATDPSLERHALGTGLPARVALVAHRA
ncbi:MAG: DUF3459 domain-containing protein, partial [Ilumatobacter sp.]|nr:DUF3459 domain-containing protein [Ilumatobacter sp.]